MARVGKHPLTDVQVPQIALQARHTLLTDKTQTDCHTQARQPDCHRVAARPLRLAYGRIPDARANDGMVPTRSQVWGTVVRAVWADHLDVIGHFALPTHVPPHFDWLASGTGFTRGQFEETWRAIATFVGAAGRS